MTLSGRPRNRIIPASDYTPVVPAGRQQNNLTGRPMPAVHIPAGKDLSHIDVFDNGEQVKVFKTIRKPMRFANKGEAFLRCDNCGDTDFTIILKPDKNGTAQLTKAVCSRCDFILPINDKGQMGGSLKADIADARKREQINERPDT